MFFHVCTVFVHELPVSCKFTGTQPAALPVGGCSDDDDEDELVGNWVKVSDFDGVARCSAVTFTVDGKVYVAAGGYGGYKYKLNDLWAFNEDSGTWTQMASMEGEARTYAVGFSTDRYGYVGLGYDGDNYLKDFWRYDPASNSWSQVSDFGGSARRAAVSFSVLGTGYVGCGFDGNHLKDFWKYNEDADSWEQITSIGGSKRIGASSFVIDDIAYVVGGENNSDVVTDFWAFGQKGGTACGYKNKGRGFPCRQCRRDQPAYARVPPMISWSSFVISCCLCLLYCIRIVSSSWLPLSVASCIAIILAACSAAFASSTTE